MSGRTYADVISDSDSFTVKGREIAIASKASLIAWKSQSVREKVPFDAMALRRLLDDPRAFD